MYRIVTWIAFFAFVFLAAAYGSAKSGDSSPTVNLDAGTLVGERFGSSSKSAAFLGVPYAAPPVGELRWKPPQPIAKWNGSRSATQFGAACPQLPASWFPHVDWKEDCLYLNVWTPNLSAKALLPVLVYFHGGGNTQGVSQMTPLGPVLSPRGLVVVSANYRLGPFGFMAHSALTAESPHHSSGNYGLLDQIQALQWVRENIARFGGDPTRVTAIGQSAGAVDVCLLMASPLSTGLFQRAIMESGDCQGTFNEDIRTPIPYNLTDGTGEGEGERLTEELGATGSGALEKLRSLSADQILKSWAEDRKIHFDAIVDGWIVPGQPATIFSQGRQMRIPVLVGSNADEATVFGHNDVTTVGEYKDYLRRDTGKYWEREFAAYPVASDNDVAKQYLRLESDSFEYGAYSFARNMTRAGQKAYLYYFTYPDSGKRASLGAHHGLELEFLSNAFPEDWQPTNESEKLGEEIRTYWTQFAKTADPNVVGLTPWPPYKDHANEYFELGRSLGSRRIPARIHAIGEIMQDLLPESGGAAISSDAH